MKTPAYMDKLSKSLLIKKYYEKGYNRNLIGGKRRCRGIQKYGHLSLADRVIAESKALTDYLKRVGQLKK